MAARWLESFRDVPWKGALSLAPGLVDRCRQVWSKVSARRPVVTAPTPREPIPAELRFPELERRIRQLESEAAASFEVVSSIAQQHSQLAEQHAELVRVADLLLVRTRALLWAWALLALAFLGVLVFVLGK